MPRVTIAQSSTGAEYPLLHLASLMALFVAGLYCAAFGPVLPFVAHDLDVSLDTAGLLLTVLFAGSIAASAAVALALHGQDPRRLTLAGLSAVIVGTLLLGFAPTFALAVLAGATLGIGDGLIIAALHILVGFTAKDVPSAVNRLNLHFAFGAIAGAIWSGIILASTGERWIVYAGIAVFAAAALAVLTVAGAPPRGQTTTREEAFRLPGNPTAWAMGVVLFLYVGAEFGLGSWVSSYARESAHASVLAGALMTSGFWGAMAAGRLLNHRYFSRGGDPMLMLVIAAAGAGIAAFVLSASSGVIALAAVAAFAAGLFLGPVWPTTMAIATRGSMADATATTVTMGNAGGVVVPWLQGKVLVGAGPSQGVAVTGVLCGVMFAIVAMLRARRSGTTAALAGGER
jgi:predicted MFS family arabinose efflux permease